MLSNVPQKVREIQFGQPVRVVNKKRLSIAGLKVQNRTQLCPDRLDVADDLFLTEQFPLYVPTAWVSDETCAATSDRDRAMTCHLQPPQSDDLNQVGGGEAGGGGIESRVDDKALIPQDLRELWIRHLMDQTPPLELFEDVGYHESKATL